MWPSYFILLQWRLSAHEPLALHDLLGPACTLRRGGQKEVDRIRCAGCGVERRRQGEAWRVMALPSAPASRGQLRRLAGTQLEKGTPWSHTMGLVGKGFKVSGGVRLRPGGTLKTYGNVLISCHSILQYSML